MAESRPLRAALVTLGCRANFSETDHLRARLQQAGYDLVDFSEPADLYIVNTCTVTHVADRKSRQLLRRAIRTAAGALVVAVGCYAEMDPSALQQIEGVDLVLGRQQQAHLIQELAAALQDRGRRAPPIPHPEEPALVRPAHPARALVKVQDGCDNHCSYCIVTLARGPSRSRPAAEILAEIRQLEQAGYSEIILTGINLGVYRDKAGGGLARLGHRILTETDIERIRFSSIEPQDFPLDLLDLWPNPRLCRHFHLPLQSGCDRVLQQMGRKYGLADYAQLLEQIRRAIPQVALSTDVIAGFPGETEQDFEESVQAIQSLPLSDLHVFPFSARPGTVAAGLPQQVSAPLRRERCQRLHQQARQLARSFRLRFLGQQLAVHWEGRRGQEWQGLSDNYLRVVARSGGNWLSQITPTHIERLEENTLRGHILQPVPVSKLKTGQISGFVV